MSTLLDKASLTYLRRLAKELNKRTDGFYFQGERWTLARATAPVHEGSMPMFRISRKTGEAQISRDVIQTHSESRGLNPIGLVFMDGQGREIVASREFKPRK